MRRKTRRTAAQNHERWLVSYADFITLLFAFFVVLFSSSQVDKRKVGQLALAIQVAFQKMGVFPASNTQVPVSASEPMPFSTVQIVENVQRTENLGRFVPSAKGTFSSTEETRDLTALRRKLEKVLSPEISRKEIALRADLDGLVISLREIGFFDSGSATIKAGSLSAFDRIAKTLMEHPYHIRIEGHTDNVPIHNAKFASNWELSSGRSLELVRLLITRYNFAPSRLSTAGYAEYHPIADNSTPEGRAQNRRVDIVVVKKDFSVLGSKF